MLTLEATFSQVNSSNLIVLPPPNFQGTPSSGGSGNYSFNGPGFSSVPALVSNLTPIIPETQKPPGAGLLIGTVKAVLKDELPRIPAAGPTISAAIAGKKLADKIQTALDAGHTPAEAYVCQTAEVLTEELAGKAIKGAIVGGIPPYLAAATTSPIIAATVPVVVNLIPPAYQGAQTTAKIVGAVAETICHQGFSKARELSKKRE